MQATGPLACSTSAGDQNQTMRLATNTKRVLRQRREVKVWRHQFLLTTSQTRLERSTSTTSLAAWVSSARLPRHSSIISQTAMGGAKPPRTPRSVDPRPGKEFHRLKMERRQEQAPPSIVSMQHTFATTVRIPIMIDLARRPSRASCGQFGQARRWHDPRE